jgi:hypothetical protein
LDLFFISITNGTGANNRRRIILIRGIQDISILAIRARGFNRIRGGAHARLDLAEGHYARQPDLAGFIIIRGNNQFSGRKIE